MWVGWQTLSPFSLCQLYFFFFVVKKDQQLVPSFEEKQKILANIFVVTHLFVRLLSFLLTFRYFTICKFPFYWMRREEISNGKYSKKNGAFIADFVPFLLFIHDEFLSAVLFGIILRIYFILFYSKSTIDTKGIIETFRRRRESK